MHLLSSDKISFFNGNMAQVCFSSKPFLKQLASHVSAATLQLKFKSKFFLIHHGH